MSNPSITVGDSRVSLRQVSPFVTDIPPEQQETACDVIENFSQATTFHGCRYIFMQNTQILRRVLWSIFLLCCISACLYQSALAVDQYIKYESINSLSTERHTSLDLPAVTICNVNQLRLSLVQNFSDEQAEALKHMIRHIFSPFKLNSSSIPVIGKQLSSIPGNIRDFLRSAITSQSDTFLQCEYLGILNCSDYIHVIETDRGSCFSFNNNLAPVGKPLQMRKNRPTLGYTLTLNADVDDYFAPVATSGVGFKVRVHEIGEDPLMSDYGTYLAPGLDATLSVQKLLTTVLDKPYSLEDCTDDHSYSFANCQGACWVDNLHICDNCSMIHSQNVTCDVANGAMCLMNNAPRLEHGDVKCNCPPQCTSPSYIHHTTAVRYPNYLAVESARLANWTHQTDEALHRNVLRLTISYETLSTTKINQIPVVNQWQLLSTIGGLMGLFLGASVVTACEFPDFIIGHWYKQCQQFRRHKNTVQRHSVYDATIPNGRAAHTEVADNNYSIQV